MSNRRAMCCVRILLGNIASRMNLQAILLGSCALLAAAHGIRHHRQPADVTGRVDLETCTQPQMRPPSSQRLYVSPAVDAAISALVPKFKDPNLATLFSNTLPNSLDTTVYSFTGSSASNYDTFIITGDIIAMWLRDSTNQVLPYARYLSTDAALRKLYIGLINRQANSVLIDAYANAYQMSTFEGQGPHSDDQTYRTLFAGSVVSAMTPAIFERKWEVDSLANVLHLAYVYYTSTGGDTTPFNSTWVDAVTTILSTFRAQQLDTATEDSGNGPAYVFQRTTNQPSDSLESGRGYPVKYTGMIKGGFRASDDACIYNYNIPENAFASVALQQVSTVLTAVGQSDLAAEALNIAAEVQQGLQQYGTMQHPTAGLVWAYEVDGFGNALFMDDANIPSLLSMPYYGFVNITDKLYQNTRNAVLSSANVWYLNGTAGAGVGGPHNGWPYIWPMSILMEGWTAQTDSEITAALNTLHQSSACTGLMHESFNKVSLRTYAEKVTMSAMRQGGGMQDNVNDYTRPWFAWVNSLFGSFILKLVDERPYLILQ